MTYEELVTSLEIASIALEKFKSYLAHELDLNDEYLAEVSQNLNYFLNLEFSKDFTTKEKLEIIMNFPNEKNNQENR